MPALVATCAVALAGTAVGLDHRLLLAVTRWSTGLTGSGELETTPVPVARTLKAQGFEELPGDTRLHLHVAALGSVQIVSDDVEGTCVVPGVGDLDALSRLAGQPYHLLT